MFLHSFEVTFHCSGGLLLYGTINLVVGLAPPGRASFLVDVKHVMEDKSMSAKYKPNS